MSLLLRLGQLDSPNKKNSGDRVTTQFRSLCLPTALCRLAVRALHYREETDTTGRTNMTLSRFYVEYRGSLGILKATGCGVPAFGPSASPRLSGLCFAIGQIDKLGAAVSVVHGGGDLPGNPVGGGA